jgi:hypothetical protein
MKRLFTFILVAMLAVSSAFAKNNALSAPIDTIDVVCHDLKLDTDFIGLFGMAYIFANNSDYHLTGAIFADSIPPGTYTDCVMDLKHIATQKTIPAASVTITLAVDANRNCVITGHMIGEDNIYYNLHLSWTPPTAIDTVHIAFDTPSSVAYYPDLYHDFMLSNKDANFDISLDIVGVPMGGTFTERNLNIAYCLIANRQTHDTISIAAAEGQVWQSNDTTYLSANVLGFDSVIYDIDLWYAVPAVIDTQEIHIYNATFYNELEKDGYFALVGTTADQSIEFAISLLGNTVEDVPGTYVNDGMFGGFTGENYDFIHFIGGSYSTYLAKWNETRHDYDILSVEKGQAQVTMDEEQDVTLVGEFVAEDGVVYHVTMTSKVDKPRIQDDAMSGAVERIFTDENQLVIEQLEEDKIRLEIMTESDLMALWFYVEYIDDEILIPEGEYTIDDSNDYWSVIQGDGSLGKSFYSTHDGEYFTSLYFLVGGMVKVTKKDGKLHFEMHAVNSYDVPVHVVYAPRETGLHDIDINDVVSVKKMIINGQLIIMRNGKACNMMGMLVK